MGKKTFAGGLESLLQLSTEEEVQPVSSEFEKEQTAQSAPNASPKTSMKLSQKGLVEGEIRATFIVKEETLEQFKALAYWERKQIKFIAQEALEAYILKNKDHLKKAEKAYKERPHR